VLSDLANLTNRADGSLVLGVVLGSVECTGLKGVAAVNGSVTGSANLKLGELIVLDFYSVMWVALTLRLHSLGL